MAVDSYEFNRSGQAIGDSAFCFFVIYDCAKFRYGSFLVFH